MQEVYPSPLNIPNMYVENEKAKENEEDEEKNSINIYTHGRKIRQCEFYGNRYIRIRIFYTKYSVLQQSRSEENNTKIFIYLFIYFFHGT